MLSVFDVESALGEDGSPQVPKVQFNSSIVRYVFVEASIRMVGTLTIAQPYVRHPKPFKCTIKPRSDDAIQLVKEACDKTSY